MCITQKRLNLTRTVRKLPINDQLERVGHYIHDDRQLDIKYDELPDVSCHNRPRCRANEA